MSLLVLWHSTTIGRTIECFEKKHLHGSMLNWTCGERSIVFPPAHSMETYYKFGPPQLLMYTDCISFKENYRFRHWRQTTNIWQNYFVCIGLVYRIAFWNTVSICTSLKMLFYIRTKQRILGGFLQWPIRALSSFQIWLFHLPASKSNFSTFHLNNKPPQLPLSFKVLLLLFILHDGDNNIEYKFTLHLLYMQVLC